MADSIKVICDNLGGPIRVAMGTPLSDVAAQLTPGPHPYLAAYVNNRIKELNYKVYTPITVRYIDATHFEGIRVYERTASFILQRAVRELFPEHTFYIRHSMLRGFYCEIEGRDGSPPERPRRSNAHGGAGRRGDRSSASAYRCSRSTPQAITPTGIRRQDRAARHPSAALQRPVHAGRHGRLLLRGAGPLDGLHRPLRIEPYYNGFYLALPLRTNPDVLNKNVQQEKMFGIFQEYQSWVRIMGVPTVGDVNSKVLAGDAGGMIKLAEAFHERKFAWVADTIYDANLSRGVRIVLISGPSSSGKTTSAKRLGIQLGVLGLKPVLISLDDYFVDREKTPKDADGEYDYEALEAIDLELFNDHLRRLMRGESVDIPRYNFITGRRMQHNDPLTLDERSILIVEGIHGLNPRLTPGVPEEQKFRIYISCFTSVAMDNLSRIATTDNRLLRRLTRDYRQRGADALATLSRWASVRRGEEKHIFPYQENADVMLNSSLFYEISVLRPFAEKILREVPDTVPEYDEARRMLKFLDNFIPIPPDEIPPTSILREFIGGSSFQY